MPPRRPTARTRRSASPAASTRDRLRRLLAWLLLAVFPLQASAAVILGVRGPAHVHQATAAPTHAHDHAHGQAHVHGNGHPPAAHHRHHHHHGTVQHHHHAAAADVIELADPAADRASGKPLLDHCAAPASGLLPAMAPGPAGVPAWSTPVRDSRQPAPLERPPR